MSSELPRFRRLGLFVVSLFLTGTVTAQVDDNRLNSLIASFRAEKFFSRQFKIGEEIAELADARAVSALEPWLKHEDRHVRGIVAFVFAKFEDPRGFATIVEILDDYSAERRVEWHVGSLVFSTDESPEEAMERYLRSPAALHRQIASDRYFAVHLLGELRDPQAVDVLVPLLDDEGINYKVAWALGEIGDQRAIPDLIGALKDPDALVRTIAVQSLAKMRAAEARPYIEALLTDAALPNAGDRIPVGETARTALRSLE